MKNKYEAPEIKVNLFDTSDVLTASGEQGMNWDPDWNGDNDFV